MGDEPTTEDVGVLRDEAAAEADECRHALAGMGEIGREPEKHLAAFHLAVQRMTPEREAALQAEAQAEAMVAANDDRRREGRCGRRGARGRRGAARRRRAAPAHLRGRARDAERRRARQR